MLGIYETALAATHPGKPPAVGRSNPPSNLTPDPAQAVLPFPFQGFKLCVFSAHRKAEVSYAVILLGYGKAFLKFIRLRTIKPTRPLKDLVAFLIILYLAGRSAIRQLGIPTILDTITRDATRYFLVIFTAHFALVVMLLFTRVSLITSFANVHRCQGFSLAFYSTTPSSVSPSSRHFPIQKLL